MNYRSFLIVILIFQSFVYAQQDAWVYLTDKPNVAQALQNPISILSQQAVDRKEAHSIPIDERDVPVNENYISQLKAQAGITVMAKSKWFNAVHVRGTQNNINALLSLSFVDSIDFADNTLDGSGRVSQQADKFSLETTLTDFEYGTTQNQVEMINVNALHEMDFTGEGIVIAVLDAGFPNVNTMGAFQRIRDNNDLLGGYDFVNRTDDIYAYTGNTHGTKVLSTMAGYIQDLYVGTAPDASYYLFRTEDAASENPIEESYWVEAAERADSLGVHVINSSLGYNLFDNPNYSHSTSDMNGTTAFISRGANVAAEKGVLVITSAGNWGNDSWQIVAAPADAPGAFSIGAVDSEGNYASFSSQGSSLQPTQKPDIAAKGLGASVINENNDIVYNNGTSFSSPIIAGAMASFMQALPDANIDQLKQWVRMSASQYGTPDFFLGFGIPDFGMALENALSVQDQNMDMIKFYPNPVKDQLNIYDPGSFQDLSINIFDLTGKLVLHGKSMPSDGAVNVSRLATGMYLLELKSETKTLVFKLIKE